MRVNNKKVLKGLASSLSDESPFEVSKTGLVVDSRSTDQMVIDKAWFKNYQKLETIVNNPDGGKTKVKGKGDVDGEARDTKAVLHKFFKFKFFISAYRDVGCGEETNLLKLILRN